MKSYKEGALVFLNSEHYNYVVSKGIDIKRLKSGYVSLTDIQHNNNVIMSFHGANGKLSVNREYHHPADIIRVNRSNVEYAGSKCFDIFSCHIGTGIQSSHESRRLLEKKYKDNLLVGEYVILNAGNKATSVVLNRAEIARTIKDGDDKCPPYIRVLRRMCYCPETIKFLYVVKERNPKTKELENKLVTHKFSALKLTPPEQVTIDKIRAHLLNSMERFKNEFLSYIDEEEKKSRIRSEITQEIKRLKREVLSKNDHLVSYGNKTLFLEVHRGKIDRVRTYLGSEFDVNSFVEDGTTPLHIASYKGHLEIVAFLLSIGADPSLCDKNKEKPLYSASRKGYVQIVRLLLNEGEDPNSKNRYGNTPLLLAIRNGHIEVVDLLLMKGADPNLNNKYGDNPLYIASKEGKIKVVDILLKAGANPNLNNKHGETPLYIASKEGKVEVVNILLKAGTNPNLSCSDGVTPLFIASQNGNTRIVELLLKQGANPNLCRENGVTPLFMASQNGHTRIVKILLNAGADPNLSRNDQTTPIVTAIFGQHTEVVKLLLPKVNLKMCKWQGKDVEELIKGKITNKEKKEDLLDILYLQTNKALEPKKDKLHGKRKRLDYDEELPRDKRTRLDSDEEFSYKKRKELSSKREKIPSTRVFSYAGDQLDSEEQMEH